MSSRILLISSAIFLGILGVTLTFLPAEFIRLLQPDAEANQTIFLQICGALYFGFAMLNWLSRGTPVGGIYNRPLTLANFSHFMIAMFALLKASGNSGHISLWLLTAFYVFFTVVFGYALFNHPAEAR